MAIDPIGILDRNVAGQTDDGRDVIDKNEFMLLLVTQLQNQDPLNPMENAEFISQTAQFASLGELQNLNTSVETLHSYQAALFNENVVSFIGKDVKAMDNEINMNDGLPDELNFELEKDAVEIAVSIYDSSGEVSDLVKTINVTGAFEAGDQNLQWDGTDDEGNPLSDGKYYYMVQADDTAGNTFYGQTFYTGTVNSVSFSSNGTAYLATDDRELSVSNVMMIFKSE